MKKVRYQKTENPKIILKIEEIETEIHLDKLKKQIRDTEKTITSLRSLTKTEADQETLDEYNLSVGADPIEITRLEGILAEKKELQKKLENLNVGSSILTDK